MRSIAIKSHSVVIVLDESTFYKQPDKLRLQLIFYLGHTSAVYINKLQLSGALQVCAYSNALV